METSQDPVFLQISVPTIRIFFKISNKFFEKVTFSNEVAIAPFLIKNAPLEIKLKSPEEKFIV